MARILSQDEIDAALLKSRGITPQRVAEAGSRDLLAEEMLKMLEEKADNPDSDTDQGRDSKARRRPGVPPGASR
jgi:hypothetical protein